MLERPTAVACLLLAAATSHADGQRDSHRWIVGGDVGLAAAATSLESWIDGGVGKLRYSRNQRDVSTSRWYAQYSGRLSTTWILQAAVDAVDDASSGLGVTEAYVEWRPVPRSPNRQRVKIGFFHGPWSLENTGPAWSTPLTLSASAVNTWLGEEVRPLGAEWSLQRRFGARSQQQFTALAAAFEGNDPAGSLLAWKGWSLHDRQSRFDDKLPLATLPLLRPGAMFEQQSPYVQPWREIDGRAGYYVGAAWRTGRRAEITLAHYDNRADPTQIDAGQYAWHTQFAQIATQIELPAGIGVLAQWMRGRTAMGPVLTDAHAVDDEFAAAYVLATKRFGPHRLTLRRDVFDVGDLDRVPSDDNTDSGDAWTIAYRYESSAHWSVGAEWLRVASWHPAWQYFGLAPSATERLLELRAILQFGPLAKRD